MTSKVSVGALVAVAALSLAATAAAERPAQGLRHVRQHERQFFRHELRQERRFFRHELRRERRFFRHELRRERRVFRHHDGAGNAGPARESRNGGFLFRGTLTGTPVNGAIMLSVTGGNRTALKLMIAQPASQTFSYDGATVFVRGQHGSPAQVDPSALEAGDRIAIRIRAARTSTLAQLQSTAAARVADRGPRTQTPQGSGP